MLRGIIVCSGTYPNSGLSVGLPSAAHLADAQGDNGRERKGWLWFCLGFRLRKQARAERGIRDPRDGRGAAYDLCAERSLLGAVHVQYIPSQLERRNHRVARRARPHHNQREHRGTPLECLPVLVPSTRISH